MQLTSMRQRAARTLRWSAALVALAPLLGSRMPAASGAQAVHRGFPANVDVAMRVLVPSGRVRVVAWDRDSIDIRGTIGPRGSFYGGGGGTHAKFGVEPRESNANTLPDGDLTVMVPRRARAWVKVTSGAIEASGVAGELELYAVGGSIIVRDARGVVSVESIEAPVTIERTDAAVRVRGGKGRIRLTDVRGTVSVASVSGPVELAGARAPDARIETIGGAIAVDVVRVGGATVDLQSHSGDITIAAGVLPALDLVSRAGRVPTPVPAGNAAEGRITARSFKGAINARVSGDIKGAK